jgi:transposase
MEDLKGIRNQKKIGKRLRTMLNLWAFNQLQTFVEYKAVYKGCSVVYVSATYTSQRCSKCGYTEKGNRTSQSEFKCRKCGHKLNADLNGSKNIALRGKTHLACSQMCGVLPTTLLLSIV